MLLKKTYHIIGLQLLLLHVSSPFVLLTANIEDVKKLASNFVSETFAEKIAEFIAKATEQIIANVSAENEINVEKYPYESNMENNGPSAIARHAYMKKAGINNLLDLELHEKKNTRKIERKSKSRGRHIEKRRISAIEKQTSNKERKDGYYHPTPLKPAHQTKQYLYLTFNKPSENDDKNNKKYKHIKVSVSPVTIQTTFDHAEVYKHNDREPISTLLRHNFAKGQRSHNFTDVMEKTNTIDFKDHVALPNSDTSNTSDSSNYSDTSSEIKKKALNHRSPKTVTEKDKFGFDPIATSGPLTFPKNDMKAFWDKEFHVNE